MIYTPHILQQCIPGTSTEDENGNPVTSDDSWENVCKCRCDDNGKQKMVGQAGEGVIYNQHIVLDGVYSIKDGTKVRVMDGEVERASGTVIKCARCNRLPYSEIFL